MATFKKFLGIQTKSLKKFNGIHIAYCKKIGAIDRWTPSLLASKLLWIRAYKVSGIADGAPLTNGSVVDESGKGYNPTMSGTTAPLLVLNQRNGLPVFRFSGSNGMQLLNTGTQESDFDVAQFSIFSTVKMNATSGATITGKNTTSTNDGTRRKMQLRGHGGVLGLLSGADANAISTAMTMTNWNIAGAIARANNDTDLVPNGSVVNSTSAMLHSSFNNARFEIGQTFGNGAERLNGDIGELLVVGAAISTTERDLLRNYLAGVWGIAI